MINGRIGHKATHQEDADYMLECCARTLLRDYKKHERRKILKNIEKKHPGDYVSRLKRKMMELHDAGLGIALSAKR